jgi:hypothetical protein
LGLEGRSFGKWEVGRASQLEAAGNIVVDAAVVREDGRGEEWRDMEWGRIRVLGRDTWGWGEETAVGMGCRMIEVVVCKLVEERDIVGFGIVVLAVEVAEVYLPLVVAVALHIVAEGCRDLVVGLLSRQVVLSG